MEEYIEKAGKEETCLSSAKTNSSRWKKSSMRKADYLPHFSRATATAVWNPKPQNSEETPWSARKMTGSSSSCPLLIVWVYFHIYIYIYNKGPFEELPVVLLADQRTSWEFCGFGLHTTATVALLKCGRQPAFLIIFFFHLLDFIYKT